MRTEIIEKVGAHIARRFFRVGITVLAFFLIDDRLVRDRILDRNVRLLLRGRLYGVGRYVHFGESNARVRRVLVVGTERLQLIFGGNVFPLSGLRRGFLFLGELGIAAGVRILRLRILSFWLFGFRRIRRRRIHAGYGKSFFTGKNRFVGRWRLAFFRRFLDGSV